MNDQEPAEDSLLDRAVGVAGAAAAAGVDRARNLRGAAAPAGPHRPSFLDAPALGVVRPGGDPEALAIVAMQLLIGDHVASLEDDEERRAKMERVVASQNGVLDELHPDPKGATRFLAWYGADLSVAERIGLLLDAPRNGNCRTDTIPNRTLLEPYPRSADDPIRGQVLSSFTL